MDSIWDVVVQSSQLLAAHEIIGILETIQQKIGFDHNVRQANEEIKARRTADTVAAAQTSPVQAESREPGGPSPIIDKYGFPVE
jgi:hypothetical protein